MAENKGILPSSTFNTLGNNSNKWEAVYAKKLVGPLTGNVTGNVSGSSGSCTGNAATATKATQDSAGQQINTTYLKGLSISGQTITYTKGNGSTGTITVPTGAGAKEYVTESVVKAPVAKGGWYRCYSDGWIEQSFLLDATSFSPDPSHVYSPSNKTITFFKPFKDYNYYMLFSFICGGQSLYINDYSGSYTNLSFTIKGNKEDLEDKSYLLNAYFCGYGA